MIYCITFFNVGHICLQCSFSEHTRISVFMICVLSGYNAQIPEVQAYKSAKDVWIQDIGCRQTWDVEESWHLFYLCNVITVFSFVAAKMRLVKFRLQLSGCDNVLFKGDSAPLCPAERICLYLVPPCLKVFNSFKKCKGLTLLRFTKRLEDP